MCYPKKSASWIAVEDMCVRVTVVVIDCCGAAGACGDVCNYAFVCESWMCTLHMCTMAVFKRNVMMGHFQACDCLDW